MNLKRLGILIWFLQQSLVDDPATGAHADRDWFVAWVGALPAANRQALLDYVGGRWAAYQNEIISNATTAKPL